MSGSEKSDDFTTTERIMQVEEMYYRQHFTQDEIARVLGVSQPAVSQLLRKTPSAHRVHKSLEDYVTDHYAELQFLKAEAAGIPKLAQKIEVMLQILDREMRLLGTQAPTKQSVELTGLQLDPLTIEVRTLLFDLPEAERIKVRDYAKTLVPPVVIDAECFSNPEPKKLTGAVPHVPSTENIE